MKGFLVIISLFLCTLARSQSFYLHPEPLGFGKFHPDSTISYNVSLSFGYEIVIPSGIGEISFYPEIFGMIQSTNRLEYGARIGMGIPIGKYLQIIPYTGAICIEDTAMGRYQLEMVRSYSIIMGLKIERRVNNVLSLSLNYGKTYYTNFVNAGIRVRLKRDDTESPCKY